MGRVEVRLGVGTGYVYRLYVPTVYAVVSRMQVGGWVRYMKHAGTMGFLKDRVMRCTVGHEMVIRRWLVRL